MARIAVTSWGYRKCSCGPKSIRRISRNSRVLSLCSSEKFKSILLSSSGTMWPKRSLFLILQNILFFFSFHFFPFYFFLSRKPTQHMLTLSPFYAWKDKSASGRKIKILLIRNANGGAGCTGASPDLSSLIASRRRETTVIMDRIVGNVLLQRMLCFIFLLLVHAANEKVPSWQPSFWFIGKVI